MVFEGAFWVDVYAEIESFLAEAGAGLAEREAEHNLILGLCEELRSGRMRPEAAQFFVLRREGRYGGCAIRPTPRRALLLSHLDEISARALGALLPRRAGDLPRVLGAAPSVNDFAGVWAERFGLEAQVTLRKGAFVLEHPAIAPRSCDGRMVRAGGGDAEVVTQLLRGFMRDCFPGDDEELRARESMDRLLAPGKIALWLDASGRAVSIAACNRETSRGATVSLVYTPVDSRGRGYASAVVAQLSNELLSTG